MIDRVAYIMFCASHKSDWLQSIRTRRAWAKSCLHIPSCRWLLTLAIAFSLSLPAAAEPHQVNLHLKWYHQFQFAGYYAAVAQGYYRDEGLAVNLIEGGADKAALEALLGGQVQYAITDAEVLLDRLQGRPIVAVAAILQHSPYIILSRADRGIRSISDLAGKKVMFEDGQGGMQFKAMLMRRPASQRSAAAAT